MDTGQPIEPKSTPNRTVTLPNLSIFLPGGLTTLVPIIATRITGTPVCNANQARPVLPLRADRPASEGAFGLHGSNA